MEPTKYNIETQESITDWGKETFGRAVPLPVYKRMKLELDELHIALYHGSLIEIGSELADVAIMLYQLSEACGIDLHDAIDRKMIINRQRKWKLSNDGTGHHIHVEESHVNHQVP